MTERMVEIKIPYGLHLRPAGKLADVISRSGVRGSIQYKNAQINLGSVLNMVAAGIRNGTTVTVRCIGATPQEEERVLDELEAILSDASMKI